MITKKKAKLTQTEAEINLQSHEKQHASKIVHFKGFRRQTLICQVIDSGINNKLII